MSSIIDYIFSGAFIGSVIVITITVLILNVIKKYLIKKVAYTTKGEQHANTFAGVIFSVLQYLVIVLCAVIVLKLNGVNVTSIITGLGIVATIVGLALQDTLKDIISGINIYNNNFYKVGDLVIYEGTLCDVKYFSARVTKFQSIVNGNSFTVCNSLINSIEKVKDCTNVNLIFDFETDKKKIDKCFTNTIKKMEGTKDLKRIDYFGLCDITNEGMKYSAAIFSPGHKVWPVRLKFYDILYAEFLKAKISPSFNDERKIKKI